MKTCNEKTKLFTAFSCLDAERVRSCGWLQKSEADKKNKTNTKKKQLLCFKVANNTSSSDGASRDPAVGMIFFFFLSGRSF